MTTTSTLTLIKISQNQVRLQYTYQIRFGHGSGPVGPGPRSSPIIELQSLGSKNFVFESIHVGSDGFRILNGY